MIFKITRRQVSWVKPGGLYFWWRNEIVMTFGVTWFESPFKHPIYWTREYFHRIIYAVKHIVYIERMRRHDR